MTKHVSGAEAGPATMHAPVHTGTYDPERWMEVQAFIPEPNQHSLLPRAVSKAQAMATVCSALRLLGAREIDIAAWRLIADVTDRKAWHDPARSPVNWKRQCDLARELGISERHWRRIEGRLSDCGVLARMTADNGYRGRRSGQPYGAPISCGLSLEPALANFRVLAGIVERAALAEEARQELALTARTARRRIGILVASLKDIETRRWAKGRLDELDDGLRPVSTRVASHGDLSAWQEALVSLEGDIREAMTPCPFPDGEQPVGPATASERPSALADDAGGQGTGIDAGDCHVENVQNQQFLSGAPDSGVRCHIQPVQESESIQHEEGAKREPPDRNPTPGLRMTERDMRNLASEDLALWLDAADDWQDALPHVLRELGINVSAWHDACDAMGPPVAFLALLVIDRNRSHPDTPILNPGGALRAFTARAREGKLDLARSILGIRHRERKGRQPRTSPPPRKPS